MAASSHVIVLCPVGVEAIFDAGALAAEAQALAGGSGFLLVAVGVAAPGGPPQSLLRLGAERVVWAVREVMAPEFDLAAILAADCEAALAAQETSVRRSIFLAPADPVGAEVGGRLAARLGLAMLGKAAALSIDADGIVARRSAYGGRAELRLAHRGGGALALTRGRTAIEEGSTASPWTPVDLPAADAPRMRIERSRTAEPMLRLEGASLVVSGGRGLSEEGFALLHQIAERLGAALGASLPAIDAGFAPVSRQVGQSGKFVTPRVYLAVGISGTPQHMAGIGEATRIFAINKDAEAPIFKFAQAGIVADWREALPALLAQLR